MKKLPVIVALLALVATGCGDKIATAKLVTGIVATAITTTDSIADKLSASKRLECLKEGPEGSEKFNACYKDMAKFMKVWTEVEPKLVLANENAAKYIKAAESGKPGDYAAAITESVCLLTEVANAIPGEKWRKRIQIFINMAGAYACKDATITSSIAPERQLYVLKHLHQLLNEMGIQS